MKPPGRQGGEREQESAMICKKAKIDALRSASKATVQCNTSKITHKKALQFAVGCPVGHVLEWAKTAGQLTQV